MYIIYDSTAGTWRYEYQMFVYLLHVVVFKTDDGTGQQYC
eukprot:SAG11_NODE_11334_length_768_cov_0.744395_2_plen_39_part_01